MILKNLSFRNSDLKQREWLFCKNILIDVCKVDGVPFFFLDFFLFHNLDFKKKPDLSHPFDMVQAHS